ncbi:MAG: hypothetical protein KDA60_19090, partial [Planctomycetales bacterium]|nr:hypothetical protein [Planctomycetales bacterium]
MTAATNGSPTGMLPHHLRELRASGLTNETIEQAGIHSETKRDRLACILNRKSWPREYGNAIVFPFRDATGGVVLHRVKPDSPAQRNGKPVKYLSPTGSTVRLYVPPAVRGKLLDAGIELLITEG